MSITKKNIEQNSHFNHQSIAVACLLTAVALISLLGTFPVSLLPSNINGFQAANTFIQWTRFSGGRNLYGSPWFILLLGGLGLFVGIALFGQLRSFFGPASLITFHPVSSLRLPLVETQDMKSRLNKALLSFGYHQKNFNNEKKIEGSKNLSGKLGPLGIHLGFIVVLLAGLATLLGADVHETEIREGESLILPKEGIGLRLDKFIVFRHADSDRPSQYTSRFWIKDENGDGRHVDLSVNHPLKIGWTKIFQMRYRVEIPRAEILVYQDRKPVDRILLEAAKPYTLSPNGPTISYDKIVPDFKLTKDGIVSAGTSYERSAMRLKVQDEKGVSRSIWIFPAAFGAHGGSEKEKQYGILKLHKAYYSGVRVSYDPGLLLAYPGLFLLIFSAFYSSFAIPRRLRLLWNTEGPGDIEVRVEGWCPRDPGGLEDEVHRFVKGLL